MFFADDFLKCFFFDYSFTSSLENDERYDCEINAGAYLSPSKLAVQDACKFLNDRDGLTFILTFGQADAISFYSGSSDLDEFLNTSEAEYDQQKGEPIQAKLTIAKEKKDDAISIYDLKTFTGTLSDGTVSQALAVFDRVIKNAQFARFEVHSLIQEFNTASLYFCPMAAAAAPIENRTDRLVRLENLRSNCYFTNIESYNLTPDDFKIINHGAEKGDIHQLFNHYATILSVIYLFDITSIEENRLEFKINGYKSIKGHVDLQRNPIPHSEGYFDIYKWVYTGGNLNDKIGLARNIISLHFVKAGELGLNGGPVQSIQSSYKVYEKQNIRQYIEIRNKISDQLLGFNERATKIIETFASGFQRSAFALISFYISIIVMSVLSKRGFENIFTLDTALLSLAFLSGSFFYYLISRWEVLKQKSRFVSAYYNLKDRYTDLLDADDIARILNNDKEFNEDIQFIDEKMAAYSSMWWICMILLFSITIVLYLVHNFSQLFAG